VKGKKKGGGGVLQKREKSFLTRKKNLSFVSRKKHIVKTMPGRNLHLGQREETAFGEGGSPSLEGAGGMASGGKEKTCTSCCPRGNPSQLLFEGKGVVFVPVGGVVPGGKKGLFCCVGGERSKPRRRVPFLHGGVEKSGGKALQKKKPGFHDRGGSYIYHEQKKGGKSERSIVQGG